MNSLLNRYIQTEIPTVQSDLDNTCDTYIQQEEKVALYSQKQLDQEFHMLQTFPHINSSQKNQIAIPIF